ncbi:cell death activator CIDE-3 isoform X2 [Python bivittatus]|uniref:Cell death activator CIDE-3 isoform X2 n=1 Tax=Python bivittatus TaxID=176946 RepID=A0A9F5J4X7_PYTBI|nr:cell death activator CIDE-3 isoform X2 [Python bivittatus]
MDYAKKSLGLLSPSSLSKCVSGSASAPRLRPYRVSNCERTLRKGIMAESLNDLLEKVRSALLLVGTITVVLDEDGTSIESEEFFQTLEEGTVLLVLTEGQTWRPAKGSSPLDPFHHASHGSRLAGHLLLHAAIAGRSRGAEGRNFVIAAPRFCLFPRLSHPKDAALSLGCVCGGGGIFSAPLLLWTLNQGRLASYM